MVNLAYEKLVQIGFSVGLLDSRNFSRLYLERCINSGRISKAEALDRIQWSMQNRVVQKEVSDRLSDETKEVIYSCYDGGLYGETKLYEVAR
jgi:hypothetical protein